MCKFEYIELNESRYYREAEGLAINSLYSEFKKLEGYIQFESKKKEIFNSIVAAGIADKKQIVELDDLIQQMADSKAAFYYKNGFVDGANLLIGLGKKEMSFVIKVAVD